MHTSTSMLIFISVLLSFIDVSAYHHDEETFKHCGARLYTHIHKHNLCQPNNCTGITRPPTVPHFYSIHGKSTTKISEHCCVNPLHGEGIVLCNDYPPPDRISLFSRIVASKRHHKS